MTMPTLDTIRQAVHTAAAQYPVKRVELFGTYANGTAYESSDVDFRVEFSENPTSPLHSCGFRETPSELLKYTHSTQNAKSLWYDFAFLYQFLSPPIEMTLFLCYNRIV